MDEIQWYFPQELDQVPEILSREGVVPHSGGTGILWGGMTRVQGLMDTSRLDLKFVRDQDGSIVLGAALSYTEAAEALAKADHVLTRSLSSAATEPLRNRISLGGSISMFPYWSDLMGPLLALDAELSLVGINSGTCPLSEYVQKRKLRQKSLITSIRWPDTPWQGAYYRHTRTPTDRPAFSITVLVLRKSKRIEEIRIVLVGCSGRYRRLIEVEQTLKGAEVPAEPVNFIDAAAAQLRIDFPARMGFSAEYLEACASVELKRALAAALRSSS
ncbi:MAG: FAD binding domain-containing protein [Spirochaetia bacterium]